MDLFNPNAGRKVRAVLTIVASTWAAILAQYPHAPGWTGTVTTVLGSLVGIVQVLTHATPIGNDDVGNRLGAAMADAVKRGRL